jgi:hypothetical protein
VLPIINIDKNCKSKIINLQDIGEVNYIPLEMVKGKPFHGGISAVTSDKIILKSFRSGDIFIYSKTGKHINNFNREGKGPEEYGRYIRVSFDSKEDEIYVQDNMSKDFKIYDLKGNFKRKFKIEENVWYTETMFYKNKFIVAREAREKTVNYNFCSISKKDGSILEKIGPKIVDKIQTRIMIKNDKMISIIGFPYFRMLESDDGLYLNILSNDTLYKYDDKLLKPALIKTPGIRTSKPYKPLFIYAESKDYLFCKRGTVDKKEIMKENRGLVNFTYDKKNKEIIQAKLQNAEYKNQSRFNLGKKMKTGAFAKLTPAVELIEAYEEKQLNGKLKKLASKLDENDNPVLVLTKLN